MKKFLSTISIILILGLCVFGAYHSYLSYLNIKQIEKNQQREAYFIAREELNDVIYRLCMTGARNDINQFFDSYTHDRLITEAILSNAIVNDVPIMLAFAMVNKESQFNPRAVGRNSNSIDYGLWQLNSITFYKTPEKQMFDVMNNCRLGAQYLRSKYNDHLRWEKAILAYNCGSITRVPESSISYLCDILKLEEDISEQFIQKFLS
jgi:soluble lytic murein transglycosylase-like protein